MKSFIVLTVLASLLVACSANSKCPAESVSSKIAGIEVADNDLSSLVNLQFRTSYKYLLMSMNFNSFLKDRPGLSKLFRQHSDKLFDDSIALVKQITNRGYEYNPKTVEVRGSELSSKLTTALSEQGSLEKGVDKYKILINEANKICKNADAEMKHYVQEELLEGYVKSLRQLTGYYNNLNNFGSKDFKLGVFLFDEYLQKQ